MSPVLRVENLQTHFFTKAGVVKAVDGVSFMLERGRILGLVGESGSGKSMTGYSIMGLIDPPGKIIGGKIELNGKDITRLTTPQWRGLRGNRVAMIFQDPMMTLNPVLRIDTQMIEALTAHQKISARAARDRCREALVKVGIPSPEERLLAYPHQFSGGMRQRVAIAIALLNKPDVIIADEPTTALDVTIQGQILCEMQKMCRESGTALVWITHDLSVIAGLADDIAVMYAGKVVESGSTSELLDAPLHPYTRGLLESVPSRNRKGEPLKQIPGMTPSLLAIGAGCAFRDRCGYRQADCESAPSLAQSTGPVSTQHRVRCFHPLMSPPA
ncbi:MAG TPA: ABC transporter ATP-binding protein [Usitatibacteraceae bacterium]